MESAVQGPAGAAGAPPGDKAVCQFTSIDNELLQSEWLDRQRVHPIGTINAGLVAGNATFRSAEPTASSLAPLQNLHKSAQNDPCGPNFSEREDRQRVLTASSGSSCGESTNYEASVSVETARNASFDQKNGILGSKRSWECMEMPLSIYDKSMEVQSMWWNTEGQVPLIFSGVASSSCTAFEPKNTGEPVETYKKPVDLVGNAGMDILDNSKDMTDFQKILQQGQVRFQLGWNTPTNVEDVSAREQAFLGCESLRPSKGV